MTRSACTPVLAASAALLLSACGSTEPGEIPQPPQDGNVLDAADVLSEAQEQELERAIQDGNDRSDEVRVAVLTEDEDAGGIEDRARDVATSWGVGEDGEDNGVLVLLRPEDQEVRVEVADGAQDVLPEDATDAIVDDVMVPSFEQEHWADGLVDGTESLYATAEGEEDPTAGGVPGWAVAAGIGGAAAVGAGLLGWGLHTHRRRQRIARENLAQAEREDPQLELTEDQRQDYLRWATSRRQGDILPVAAWLPLYLAAPSSYGAAPTGGDQIGGGTSFGGGGGFTGGGSTGSW